MKKFLKSWFTKNHDNDQEEVCNQLIFSLKTTGDLSIEVILANNSEKDSVYLAKLLYELDNGIHTKDIYKLLLEVSKNNKSYTTMINNTLEFISIYYLKNDIQQPVIGPSQFYNAEK